MRCLTILFLCTSLNLWSQNSYYIQFKSKDTTKEKLHVSNSSIQRKLMYNIPIDSKDYNINENYINSIKQFNEKIKISNWLNAVAVELTENQKEIIKSFSFVDTVFLLKNDAPIKKSIKNETYTISDYGSSYNQIHIHNGEFLHDSGYDGKGMKIAVFDAGFNDVDSFNCFKHLFTENRIHFGANLVYNTDSFFDYDGHGTSVLGCMASYIKDTIVGTCPNADFYLFITEDARSESRLEEFNWAVAAEKADSIGVDVINSSLGYAQFDDAKMNYTFQDMDGNTTIVSKAAKIATEKGIIVVNSAGNEGNKSWKKITAPADVENVITVGAIDNSRMVTAFSSRGFNANKVIKPDVVAVGGGATVFYNKGKYSVSNGTSFSSPIMAGMVACFWQTNRSLTPDSVRNLIYKSSHLFTNPNGDYGFGIPDFKKALKMSKENFFELNQINIFPNPTSNFIITEFYSKLESKLVQLTLFSLQGKILSKTISTKKGINTDFIDIKGLAKGIYILKVETEDKMIERKILID